MIDLTAKYKESMPRVSVGVFVMAILRYSPQDVPRFMAVQDDMSQLNTSKTPGFTVCFAAAILTNMHCSRAELKKIVGVNPRLYIFTCTRSNPVGPRVAGRGHHLRQPQYALDDMSCFRHMTCFRCTFTIPKDQTSLVLPVAIPVSI